MKYSLQVFWTLVFLVLAACAPKPDSTAAESIETYFPIQLGDQSIEMQLALVPAEQAQGLMYRDPLPKDHGMLFVFNKAEQRSFWMRNTKIPLDIGYIDARGRLIEIHALYPFDETPVKSFNKEILMALEMNQGWFKNKGLTPGAQLDLDALVTAIRARGQNPANYALQK
jgi:Uncharacterized conserved protein